MSLAPALVLREGDRERLAELAPLPSVRCHMAAAVQDSAAPGHRPPPGSGRSERRTGLLSPMMAMSEFLIRILAEYGYPRHLQAAARQLGLSLDPPTNCGRSFPARSLPAGFHQVSAGTVAWPRALAAACA